MNIQMKELQHLPDCITPDTPVIECICGGFTVALPKIFFYIADEADPGFTTVVALAEDGTGLDAHMSSSRAFAWRDIGCGVATHPKHKKYIAHYPQGFEMIDHIGATDEVMAGDTAFQTALKRNREEPTDAPSL